ncbi:GGDEF domain-containing protein [Microbaculum marinum]|uniref:diguanylate cyclase n=1 Tax=Microbaculum marinum TaxID=1764581 RepID=A0AAW9RQT0_9HYPH
MSLDTITIAAMSVTLCVPVIVLLYMSWLSHREEPAQLWWCASFVALLFALGFYGPRGYISDFVTIDLANAMVLLSIGLALVAARSFNGRGTPLWVFLAAPALWIALCRIPEFRDYGAYRMAVFSVFNGTIGLAVAVEYWRGRAERLATRYMMVATFLLLVGVYVCRLVMVAVMPLADPREYFHANLWTMLLMLASVVVTMAIAILAIAIVNERSEATQRRLAEIDPLTGVSNRGGALRQIKAGLAKEGAGGAAVLMFDLDHFKRINDHYGHATGDEMLRRFSEVAASNMRDGDAFGRIGGEEFLGFLADVDQDAALSVAERIRQAFAAIGVADGEAQVPATVSIGVAFADTKAADLDELIHAADKALYRAKDAGRDQVCVEVLAGT